MKKIETYVFLLTYIKGVPIETLPAGSKYHQPIPYAKLLTNFTLLVINHLQYVKPQEAL